MSASAAGHRPVLLRCRGRDHDPRQRDRRHTPPGAWKMKSFPTIPILLETKDLLAVEKPELLAAIPERDREQASLQRLLEEARGEKLFVVHRLDKEVSGVILFARNAQEASAAQEPGIYFLSR